MSSFGKVGGLAPGDDALPLLSTTNKPYRKLLQTNDISIFDFRIYLFARQAAMLFHLGKITEVAKRGAFFISTFARRLREDQVSAEIFLFYVVAHCSLPSELARSELCRILDLLGVPQYCRRLPTMGRRRLGRQDYISEFPSGQGRTA